MHVKKVIYYIICLFNFNRLHVLLPATQSYLVVTQDAEKCTEHFLINLEIDYWI